MKEFKAGKNEAGQRLDKYLKKILPNASMGFIYKMLRKKNIKLNDKKASGTEIVSVDDKIKIFLSDDTFAKFSVNEDSLMKRFTHQNQPRGISVQAVAHRWLKALICVKIKLSLFYQVSDKSFVRRNISLL